MEVIRLDLGSLYVVEDPWPVHGFGVLHPQLGAILVDTGCGGPDVLIREYRVVNRSIAAALQAHGLSPADVRLIINTHLHFDHCGQNPVFPGVVVHVQRAELERVRREGGMVWEWLESVGSRFELLDGETKLADDLRIVPSPGHTAGHQSVVAVTARGVEVFVGDAAFRRAIWEQPDASHLPPGQADDLRAWERTLRALHNMAPDVTHFCHDV
jgi:N-acyl homoserine lactone hydrolase